MWFGFLIWLWRGGDSVSIQPTDLPPPVHVRTIHDIEADMVAIARDLVRHRDRQGHTLNVHQCNERLPALLVHQLEALQDEWAWHHAGGPTLDWAVDDKADEQPSVTLTGGPIDAPID